MKFKVKLVGNHWYPCIKHDVSSTIELNRKIDWCLNKIDDSNFGELTIEFEELGVYFEGINIIYFNESDIVRYLTTDDYFNLRFTINNRTYEINSDLYFLLEQEFNFNFHKNSYKIHIY